LNEILLTTGRACIVDIKKLLFKVAVFAGPEHWAHSLSRPSGSP
jgi:hypothetical protein